MRNDIFERYLSKLLAGCKCLHKFRIISCCVKYFVRPSINASFTILRKKEYLSFLVLLASRLSFMNLRRTLFSLFTVLFVGTLQAQDIHYSMFQMAPIGLNPALAGSFSGTARVGGIYRIQDVIGGSDAVSASRGYETYSFFLDAPVVRGIREQDWIGIGLGFTNDVAGIGNLRETSTIQALSYHFPLDKARQNVISFGINSGSLSYRGENNFQFEDQILTGSSIDNQFFELSQGGNQSGNGGTIDWGFGITYKGVLDKVSAMRGGISASHLNNPTRQLSAGGGGERIPVRITAFGEYDRLLNRRTRIIPGFLFQNYRSNNEFALQALVAYYLDPKRDITVYAGTGMRINTFNPIDAIPIYLGFDIGDIKTRLAFDATVSGKSYTNRGFGALELSVNYIMKVYKRPKVDPAIFCPRF